MPRRPGFNSGGKLVLGGTMFNVADTTYGAHNLDAFEYQHALRGFPPAPRRCRDDVELASWFMKFAVACRACLPKPD
jgi:hypothetical protein